MLAAALAQLRLGIALASGRPIPAWALHRLVAAARDTVREYGTIAPSGAEAVRGPVLDPETRRAVQLRRVRRQAVRAARDTAYYPPLFARQRIDPARLTWDDIAQLPLTTKAALRDGPGAFVNRRVQPALRTTTTGTTGAPTQVSFSARELTTMMALSGLGMLLHGQLTSADVVLMCTSSRATLGNLGLAGACTHSGALLQPVGLIDPALTLALLAQETRLPGRKPKPSYLSTYPSYLGELVERGHWLGYTSRDFGLERISVGGEVITAGLRRRSRAFFGEHIVFDPGYAMTETFPFAGMPCDQGHLHFDPSHGLLEVLDPDTGAPSAPGDIGSLVATPLPPFRETTLLLRYDTEDLVRALPEALTCRLQGLPGTSDLLGKRRLAVRHDAGWTVPRDVMEALEADDAVPLPARFGFWAVPDGVAVEVVTRTDDTATHTRLREALHGHGVAVRDLTLVADPARLRQPYPLRCDLRERHFAPSPAVATADPSPTRGRR
jgi:phenylacetate-coenzyme A ligase PaaK-like adenylate-forming protein